MPIPNVNNVYCNNVNQNGNMSLGMLEMLTEEIMNRRKQIEKNTTDLFYVGMNLKEIQKIMGHSSMAQTEDYIYYKKTDEAVCFLDAINE